MTTRRDWLKTAAFATGSCLLLRARGSLGSTRAMKLEALEQESGGRLGVALLDTSSGRVDGRRLDERFPMCSTFKVLAVAAMLKRVDAGKERLDRRVPIRQADLLEHAPITRDHAGSDMSVRDLCAAAITLNDNTAANLLLVALGGPAGVTRFAVELGDHVTRLDRNEPTLNEAAPRDPRDTTTPRAMAKDLEALLVGTALSAASRALLERWMLDCKTGDQKIRAGVPAPIVVADKTGAGAHHTSNDVAALLSPTGPTKILTVYLTDSRLTEPDAQAAIIAKVAAICSQGPPS